MKRTIEIEDTLQENVDSCKEQILDRLVRYVEENSDVSDFDEFNHNCGSDAVLEIIDNHIPTRYREIDSTYFLYKNELNEAFDNAGISTREECDNYEQTAIICYLSEKTHEFMQGLEGDFNELIDERDDLDSEEEQKAFILNAVKEFAKTKIEEL